MIDMTITYDLNQLAEMRAKQDAIRLHYDELRAKVLTPEIQAALDDIAAEEASALEAAGNGIEQLTAKIKAAVIEDGATVKADFLQAVYMKGRVSWNTKALNGYAAAHPEIEQFRKVGKPSVSIRVVK